MSGVINSRASQHQSVIPVRLSLEFCKYGKDNLVKHNCGSLCHIWTNSNFLATSNQYVLVSIVIGLLSRITNVFECAFLVPGQQLVQFDSLFSIWLFIYSDLGHNLSTGDGNSTEEGDSVGGGRNPAMTGIGCYKNYKHSAAGLRKSINSQVYFSDGSQSIGEGTLNICCLVFCVWFPTC